MHVPATCEVQKQSDPIAGKNVLGSESQPNGLQLIKAMGVQGQPRRIDGPGACARDQLRPDSGLGDGVDSARLTRSSRTAAREGESNNFFSSTFSSNHNEASSQRPTMQCVLHPFCASSAGEN